MSEERLPIVPIVESIIEDMDNNSQEYSFAYGEKDWQNLLGDEATFPAGFLDEPTKITLQKTASGYIGERYKFAVMFLYKSQLDDAPEQRSKYINKARLAAREFISRMEASEYVDEFTVSPNSTPIYNLFDVGVDGLIVEFDVKINLNVSVCVE